MGLGTRPLFPKRSSRSLLRWPFARMGRERLFSFCTISHLHKCWPSISGRDRPVFGIDSAFEEELYLWEESGRIAVSVEELAGRCLAELQNAQPRGPYCLAGFCFGGVLAFEVANQLRKRGEEVAFLGLLDSFYLPAINPTSVPWLTAEQRQWSGRLT